MSSSSSSSLQHLAESNYCRMCKTTTHPTRSAWISHLISSVHQMMMRVSENTGGGGAGGTKHWDPSRSLLITNCFKIPGAAILEYLEEWGPVENFSYLSRNDGGTNTCRALMKNRGNATAVCGFSKPHTVSRPVGKAITIRRWTTNTAKNAKKENLKAAGSFSNQEGTDSSNYEDEPRLASECSESLNEPMIPSTPGHFSCASCTIVSYTLSEWAIHLESIPHQKMKAGEVGMGLKAWDTTKGVLLHGQKGLSKSQIVAWGLSWGPVVDFIDMSRSKESVNSYFLFKYKDIVDTLLNFKDYHMISNRKVEVLPIPEFSGYTKLEKQMLKAEKLTTEMMSTFANSPVVEDATQPNGNSDAERYALLSALAGKTIEEQLSLILSHNAFSDASYQRANSFLQDVLESIVIRRLRPPIHTTFKLYPYGAFACRTIGKKKTLNILLNVQTSQDSSSFDIDHFPLQVDLVHKLRCGIESVINLAPGSLRAFSSDKCNRPILSFSVAEPELEFIMQIDSNNLLVTQESDLIAHYCDLDPRVRPILLILLQWNEFIPQVSSPDELFPTQLISLLVIFFLVHKQILPSVHQLCSEGSKGKDVEPVCFQGYDISFPKSKIGVKSQPELDDPSIFALSVTGLIKGFFQFYGRLDMENNVFCSRLGTLISKEHFFSGNQSNLPPELLEPYSRGNGQLYTVSPIVFQDPFILSMNLAKSRGKKVGSRFRAACRLGFSCLEKSFMEEQPSLLVIFTGLNDIKTSQPSYLLKY